MKYQCIDNKIIIRDLSQFNIEQILDCGQIFRYYINQVAEVVSGEQYAQIFTFGDRVEIACTNVEYFINFFDLDRDYNEIKDKLKKDDFLCNAIKFGYGIRILNQNVFEMIVSFIISANNNIKRIKNSVNHLSKNFGTKHIVNNKHFVKIDDSPISDYQNNATVYYSFPTLQELKRATIQDYVDAGLGYRAEYMYDTVQRLSEKDLQQFLCLDFYSQYEWLTNLKGVGEKVAHCILLFATHQTEVFPVDTWINKVYNDLTKTNQTNRKLISRELTDRYKDLSGYAQQYFFYYYRSNKQ